MHQALPNVNQADTQHFEASLAALAMLIRPGNLERTREALSLEIAHPRHKSLYRALLELPSDTRAPLEALDPNTAIRLTEATAAQTELPVTVSTAIDWLREAWANAEGAKALQSGDLARAAEAYQKIQAATVPGERSNPWDQARELFPRQNVPWEHLPPRLTESLQQLARSCATSASPLPGAVFCCLSSVVGRYASVSPKMSWTEPLIFWVADIRRSGQGKTPAARKLAELITKRWQTEETERYQQEMAHHNSLPKKERQGLPEPEPPHSYYLTQLTIEGVRDQLVGHPTGGIVAIQDEISAMITGQNEYKTKGGSDREAWLSLFDGHPARVARAGQVPITITGGRVQVYGGIQPEIFRKSFGGNAGTYIHDGTLYRFLLTFDRDEFHELTAEAWAEEHQAAWERILTRARDWVMQREEPLAMLLNEQAQGRFLEWANGIKAAMPDLPEALRGYIPKAVAYSLRLAGALHLLRRFSEGQEPMGVLSLEDIEAGIAFSEFYLGQSVDAMRLITSDSNHTPRRDYTETDILLGQVLESLRPEVDSGRLAIGHIHQRFNEACGPQQRVKSPHAMGGWLRSLGLTIPHGLHDANGKRRVRCVVWDSALEKIVSDVSKVSKSTNGEGSEMETLSNQSLHCLHNEQRMETMETLETQSLQPAGPVNQGLGDNGDNADNFSGVEI